MKPKNLPSLLIAAAAFAAGSPVAQAALQVIHNGDSYTYQFGAATASVDTTNFLSAPGSVRVNYAAGFEWMAYSATSTFTPGLVDWSQDTFTFDYMTESAVRVYRTRIHVASLGNLAIIDVTFPSGLALVGDGQWHSVTITGANWTTAYNDAVSNSTLNPNNAYSVIFSMQNATASGVINIDNIRIGSPIPEPASFALLASAGAGMMVITRRRRRA